MKFNPKGLIVTAAWILVLVTAFKTQTSSVAFVVARMRGFSALGQAGALREIRRWLPNRWNHH
jgi:hypothetical protein